MTYVVIRDDDICAFTKVSWLKKLYQPLLDENLPFCFSVIPNVRGDVSDHQENNKYWKNKRTEFEPFIPPEIRGTAKNFHISENQEVVKFIENNSNIEIAQHGYCHEVVDGEREFRVEDKESLAWKIENGLEILSKTFTQKPNFFVPPWDAVSNTALHLLRNNFKGLSCSRYPHKILPKTLLPKFAHKKFSNKRFLFWQDFLILEHPATYLSLFNDPGWMVEQVENAVQTNDVLVLVNHYWEYFFDWRDEPDAGYFDAWHKILKYLISGDGIKIVSFNKLHHILSKNRV